MIISGRSCGEAAIWRGARSLALVRRAAEVAVIRSFLSRAADNGGTLLVFGGPGTGKTCLWDTAAELASAAGARVLRAQGVQFEANVAFGALNQILLPILSHLPKLAKAHRTALSVALGLDQGARPDRLLVSTAALKLLQYVSDTAVTVIVVDDLQWLDEPSARVLGFVARRLTGSRIGLLAASRRVPSSFFEKLGLPEHELSPLDEAAAAELVTSAYPDLAAGVRARVLAEARGNPLALLELPAALSEAQRAGAEVLPTVLPLTHRLKAAFSGAICELPEPARRLLLTAALEGTGDPRVVTGNNERRPGAEALERAQRADLLAVNGDSQRLAFRHPVIRSVVVEMASDQERRAAHGDLATLLAGEPERQVWHLAAAARQPDEDLASRLEHRAELALAEGDVAGAVTSLTRAFELSQDPAERSRRQASAAVMMTGLTGDRERASELLADALRQDAETAESLEAAVAAAYLLISRSADIEPAHRLLVSAIQRTPRVGAEATLQIALYGLMLACYYGGRAELWRPFHEAIAGLDPKPPGMLQVCDETVANPVSTSAQTLERLAAAINGLAHETSPVQINRVAFAAVFVDRLAGCRAALRRVVRDGRSGTGSVVSAILALNMLGTDDLRTGRWDRAETRAAESARMCEQHNYVLLSWRPRFIWAMLAAARGEHELSRALTDEMLRWATPRGILAVQRSAWKARALDAISSGDFEEAYQYATQIAPAGQLPSHVQQVLYVPLDVVESCMRTNRHAEAAAHVAALEAAGLAGISPRLKLVVTGCAATAAVDDDAAIAQFRQAVAVPGADRWPFEFARIQLLYGERLRRAGANRESRALLNAAIERFQWLGAHPWSARALSELRATGQTRLRGGSESPEKHLTPREYQIATLAASGLRNKEISARLFLSERTVADHLHRAFPKLGVTSRAGLRDALASIAQETGDESLDFGHSAEIAAQG
jgi:DNA-binding CsgD family transcriptional regulator